MCGTRADIAKQLVQNYGEQVTVIAVTDKKAMWEFWENKETRSWSNTLTSPEGWTCILSGGTDFDHITYVAGEDG